MDYGEIGKITASFQNLGAQIEAGEQFSFPALTANQPLLWMGMGGSSLGALIWQSFCQNTAAKPLIVWQQPSLPGFINPQSTIFISSYSGQTRETLDFYRRARHRGHILGITSGGQLEKYFQKDSVPYFKIPIKLNPSGQPRHGIGFSLGFLSKFYRQQQLLPVKQLSSWRQAWKIFPSQSKQFASKNVTDLAKFIISHSTIVIIASPRFYGLGQFWQNQLQETGKKMAFFAPDPNLRHHLPEALATHKNAGVLFLNANGSRFSLLDKWLRRQEIPCQNINFPKGSDATQIIWGINFGQYLALETARLSHRDANKIAAIGWLKQQNNTNYY